MAPSFAAFRIIMKRIPGAVLLASLIHVLPATAAAGALVAYTRCPLDGKLAAVSVDHRTAGSPPRRTIVMETGQRTVSVEDGYRVMLAFPDTDPFVNLKIERSVPGQYAADKQIILDQMQAMARRVPANADGLERSLDKGIDVAALNNRTLAGGVTSMYTLFDDEQEVIATAYLLNQKPERRAFQTFDEYKVLRDRFIGDFTSCMAALRRTGAPVSGH
jgi:hypothetical protein